MVFISGSDGYWGLYSIVILSYFASILEIEAATSNHFIAMIRRVPSLLAYLILGTVKDS